MPLIFSFTKHSFPNYSVLTDGNNISGACMNIFNTCVIEKNILCSTYLDVVAHK